MPKLELLVSPPGTGKTTRCVDLFRREILKTKAGLDSHCYFVLPSREHAERVQNLVLKKDVHGLFNAHILSMNDLAEGVLAGGGPGRPTEAARRLAVSEALAGKDLEGKNPFGYFGSASGLRGFQELALEAIREFKAGLLSIGEFEARAQNLRRSDPVFAEKYRDFSILYKRYDQTLESLGFSEPDDLIAALEDLSGAGRAPGLVIFDGFYHFTRAQRKLLTLISRWADHTLVTLTLNPSHPAGDALFGYPERTRRFLKEAGFRETVLDEESRRTADPALRHVESCLFSPSPKVFRGEPPLTVISAPSKRVEFEMIAREIRRLYREEARLHYSDVCVILRSVSGRRALIESVFAEFGLPVAVHERKRLLESGLAAAIHRFLKLGIDGWLRDDVLYLAKSSYFRGVLSLEGAIELERAALRQNLTQGEEAWAALGETAKLSEGPAKFVGNLAAHARRVREAASAHAFGAAIEAFAAGLTKTEGEAADLDAAARGSLASVLASLRRRSAAAPSFSGDAAARETFAAVEDGLLSIKPAGRNRVQVYDAVMALPKEYKVVFVADLLEKVFPQSIIEDPLFKDSDRRALNGADPVLEERAWRLGGERYFFYMSVTRARERLYLTHSTHDADGKPVLASFFIEEVLRCFEKGAVRTIRKDVARFLASPGEWESAGDAARGLAELHAAGGERRDAAAKITKRWEDAPARLLSAMRAEPPSGGACFSDPAVKKLLPEAAGPFSASTLEAFLRCPFRYFAEDLLRLNQPVEGREDAHRGTLLHDVLYRFFERLPESDLRSGAYLDDPAAMKRELEALLEEGFEKSPLAAAPLYRRALWVSSMKKMLRDYVDLETALAGRGLVPAHFEYSFGKGRGDYLRLPDPEGDILIKGSIDRIDIDAEGGATVIDYKSSSRSLKKKIEKGEEIQMPIYLLAASRLLKLRPSGMEHRVLRTGSREDSGLTGELLDELLRKTEERVREAVRQIRAGKIEVAPKDCRFCDFDSLCRIEAKKKRG